MKSVFYIVIFFIAVLLASCVEKDQSDRKERLSEQLEDARKEIGDLATSEEDLISYTIFPDITKDYLKSRTA